MNSIAGTLGSNRGLWIAVLVLSAIFAMLLACGPHGGTESGAVDATAATGGAPIADPDDSPEVPAGRSALPRASQISGEIPGITEIVIEQAPAPASMSSELVPATVPAPEPAPTVTDSPARQPSRLTLAPSPPPSAATPTPEPAPAPAPGPAPAPEPTPAAATEPSPEPATPVKVVPTEPSATPQPPPCTGYRIEDLLFDSASATLTSQAADSLGTVAALIPPDATVIVVGHTDSLPAAIGNQALSEMRAEAVADALTAHGVSEAQLDRVEGRGAVEPIGPNETPEGRRMNRRVEVYVNCPDVPRN